MKLYLVRSHRELGYDSFDSMVVAAGDEEEARNIHPEDRGWPDDDWGVWVNHSERVELNVSYVGETELKRGVVLASFNAG